MGIGTTDIENGRGGGTTVVASGSGKTMAVETGRSATLGRGRGIAASTDGHASAASNGILVTAVTSNVNGIKALRGPDVAAEAGGTTAGLGGSGRRHFRGQDLGIGHGRVRVRDPEATNGRGTGEIETVARMDGGGVDHLESTSARKLLHKVNRLIRYLRAPAASLYSVS